MKKKFKFLGYGVLDWILLLSGLISGIVVGIIFHSPWFIIINTILATICVFTQAKGQVINQFIGIVYFVFYIFISYKQKLYGEAILYLVIMLPMYIYGAIHWITHRDKEENLVLVRNNLSKKEWGLMSLGFVIVSIGVFFLLKALNTSELVVSTLSFITMLPAVYLLIRRCKWNQVAFLVNDFIVPILWLLLIINGELILLPMIINFVFQIIYDTYGLIEWIKLEKKQKNKKDNNG